MLLYFFTWNLILYASFRLLPHFGQCIMDFLVDQCFLGACVQRISFISMDTWHRGQRSVFIFFISMATPFRTTAVYFMVSSVSSNRFQAQRLPYAGQATIVRLNSVHLHQCVEKQRKSLFPGRLPTALSTDSVNNSQAAILTACAHQCTTSAAIWRCLVAFL